MSFDSYSQISESPTTMSATYYDSDVEERLLKSGGGGQNLDPMMLKSTLRSSRSRASPFVNRTCWVLTMVNTVLLGLIVALLNFGLPSQLLYGRNACAIATSSYSPILQAETMDHFLVHFNGTLWPGEEHSWSRKEPGDAAAEEKWESFEEMPTFPLTREDVLALGKDPETVARFPDEVFGLGNEAYIGSLDVQHKIHCLNELRKMTFADYQQDIGGDHHFTKQGHGRLWWVHLRHCVDMLAQDLICHADADIITYQWVDTQDKPFPDFSLNRKCRSLDTVIKYREDHQVNMTKYMTIEKPKTGVTTVPMDPGYYVAYGFALSELYPDGVGYNGPWPSQEGWAGYPPVPDEPLHRR